MSGHKAKSSRSGFLRIYDVFDDKVEVWMGYPLASNTTAYRPTLYMRERCRLAGIFQEIHALILTKSGQDITTVQGFVSAVEDILGKMRHWYQRLPFELQYRWPMAISIWELRSV
jgi:hypothetical protein